MIDSGIGRLQAIQKAQEQKARNRTEIDFFGKLYGLLKGVPGKSMAEHQVFCNQLRGMDNEQRRQAILANYGEICLSRCEPLLVQLASLVPSDHTTT